MIRSASALAALLLLAACGQTTVAIDQPDPAPAADAAAETVALAEMPMDEVEKKMASGDCTVVDANSAATRTAQGVLDGAVLIDNYRTYDFATLGAPKDASLVFYCGSTLCTASDKAAHRAMAAGYTDVRVMREGIKGWKKAGKKTVEWSAPATDETAG